MSQEDEKCPDCGVVLPVTEGTPHAYMGASVSCWEMFSYLNNGNDPELDETPGRVLLVDAYAAQHPGVQKPQAVQSVAVHLLALYGVYVRGLKPERALWVRRRALRADHVMLRHNRFKWLERPNNLGSITIADITDAETPEARSTKLEVYVEAVWRAWESKHGETIAEWYKEYVL